MKLLNEWANSKNGELRERRLEQCTLVRIAAEEELEYRPPRGSVLERLLNRLLNRAVNSLDAVMIKALVMMGADVNYTIRVAIHWTQNDNIEMKTMRQVLHQRLTELAPGTLRTDPGYWEYRQRVLKCMRRLCQTHNSSECEPRGLELFNRLDLPSWHDRLD